MTSSFTKKVVIPEQSLNMHDRPLTNDELLAGYVAEDDITPVDVTVGIDFGLFLDPMEPGDDPEIDYFSADDMYSARDEALSIAVCANAVWIKDISWEPLALDPTLNMLYVTVHGYIRGETLRDVGILAADTAPADDPDDLSRPQAGGQR